MFFQNVLNRMRERLSQTKKKLKYCRSFECESPMVNLGMKYRGEKGMGDIYGSMRMMILNGSTDNSKLFSVLNSICLKYLF